jgi:hypothetical protein
MMRTCAPVLLVAFLPIALVCSPTLAKEKCVATCKREVAACNVLLEAWHGHFGTTA